MSKKVMIMLLTLLLTYLAFLALVTWGFSTMGGLLFCLRVITINPALITSDHPGQGFIARG
jgi:hypothetical protein